MSAIYHFMTLERLPDTMSPSDVKEQMAFLMMTVVRSKDFKHLNGLQRAGIIDFCINIQEILLTAYSKEEE